MSPGEKGAPSHKDVAALVLDQLEAWGVRRVYGVAGDAILPFVAAFAGRDRIEFIPVRHEEAAAFMAKAEAQATGVVGVCAATSGPGAAHLVNGLADAATDSAPVLAITGQVESFYVGTSHKQQIDQQRLLGAVTGYTAEVSNPEGLLDVLARALRTAVAAGTAAHVSIPKDLWSAAPQRAELHPYPPYLTTPARSGLPVVAEAAARLAAAERPAIVAGVGARGAVGEVLRLAEHLTAPVVYTLAASGLFPRDHRLVIGGIGEGGADPAGELLAEATCILRLGTTWWPQEYVPAAADVIDVNVKPAHIGTGAPAAYGVAGPVEEVVPALAAAPGRPRPAWALRIEALRAAWLDRLAREAAAGAAGSQGGLHPAYVVATLSELLPEDALVALDVGEHVLWFNRHFRGNGRRDILLSGYWRTMGFGLPAAIAAKLANPERPVVAFVGDGGFSMTMAELLTAVSLGAAVTVVVLNNRSLAMEENEMKRLGLTPHGVRLDNPDFAAYAALCGARGRRVESPGELKGALEWALAEASQRGRTALVDVVTAPVPIPQPPRLEATPVGMAQAWRGSTT